MTKHSEEGGVDRERHNRKGELEKWEKDYLYDLLIINNMLDIDTKGQMCHQQVYSGKRDTCISTFL